MRPLGSYEASLSARSFPAAACAALLTCGCASAARCPGPAPAPVPLGQHSASAGRFRWVNPILDCGASSGLMEHRPTKRKLLDLLASAKGSGGISQASVYYRDLDNGPWLGIDEHEKFAPASLLKLPLLMGILKRAEEEPSVLEWRVTFTAGLGVLPEQRFNPATTLTPGVAYPAAQLLEAMIRDSDNHAALALLKAFGGQGIAGLYEDLGISLPEEGVADGLQIKDYAALFRVLYNASYLDRAKSEKVLGWLVGSSFRDGLVAGVPSSVPVAHKYGERTDAASGLSQLHDCGIVYHPGNPYLLCVMTRGREFAPLADTIRRVSALVYEDITAATRRP